MTGYCRAVVAITALLWAAAPAIAQDKLPPFRTGVDGTPAARQRKAQAGQRDDAGTSHPGGQVIVRPPSTCRWAWNTVWWADAPVLNTRR